MAKPDNRISVGKTTMAILHGQMDLSEWEDEELERGQRRDRRGNWSGKPSTVIPRELYNELTRRRLSKGYDTIRDSLQDAVELLRQVIVDPNAEYKDRISAAKFVVERVMGKEPIRVDLGVTVKAPWEEAIEAMLIPESALAGVIEAASRDDEPEELDPDLKWLDRHE